MERANFFEKGLDKRLFVQYNIIRICYLEKYSGGTRLIRTYNFGEVLKLGSKPTAVCDGKREASEWPPSQNASKRLRSVMR